jgi:hypothetical protein
MRMLKKTASVTAAAVLGLAAATGVAACGEDREGDVQFQNGTGTETTGTGTTGTTGTANTGTGAAETETETAP